MVGKLKDDTIQLKRIFIESQLPEELSPLKAMAGNIWWSWNKKAEALFQRLAGDKWEEMQYNPLAILDNLNLEAIESLRKDKAFMEDLNSAYGDFQEYLAAPPKTDSPAIAYFSMEYGLHTSLRLYSGGLGVLAGDYLKEASDTRANLMAIGLLYRHGYFQQSLSLHGDQINNYPPQEFTKLPIDPVRNEQGDWLRIQVDIKDRKVFAKVWKLCVGRISLYLLDADLNENHWEDRSLTHQLYGGDNEHRLKQEILLGIGGMKVLKALGFNADIYHCNEGHAAFMGLERLRNIIQEQQLSFDEALEIVRATTLFTTHTPVPAGHDYFPEHLLKTYLYSFSTELGISWERFVALGKVDPLNIHELFSMSHLAIRLAQEVNGVSKLHGSVSQKMFNVLYPAFKPEELHMGYVTNGVHYPTWIAAKWHDLFEKKFGKGFLENQSDKKYWRKINEVPSADILEIRKALKHKLLQAVKAKLKTDLMRRGENPRGIFQIINNIREDALVIGFARRFATYKRAHLLFSNLERLAKIVNDMDRPVLFLFSGKAHPADGGGQDLIRHIINISKRPEFIGKVIFLENYNMETAKVLVQGVDIWLNTPTRPKEASGTSGMKAAMNGVMNFSVLDGWWAEGYRPDAGWALPLERTYDNQEWQNELDAETIYNMLESEIIPTFFEKDEKTQLPEKWVGYIRNIIAEVAPEFTMKRMIDDYHERFYQKLHQRGKLINAGKAKELVAWKNKVTKAWSQIKLVDKSVYDTDNHSLPLGTEFKAQVRLDLGTLSAEEVGIELLFFKRLNEEELEMKSSYPLEVQSAKGSQVTYSCAIEPQMPGVYEYGLRIFAKHPLLPHRQDLNLVKWI